MPAIPTQSLPRDVYELALPVQGTANASVDLTGWSVGTTSDGVGPSGVVFVPLHQSVTLDGTGAGTVRLVARRIGIVGKVAAAYAYTLAALPTGITSVGTAPATTVSEAGYYARCYLDALGTAYNAPDDSNNAADALAIGVALMLAHETNADVPDEAFVDTATELLAEWETDLGSGVRTDLSHADRRARLVSKMRAALAGTPQNIARAVQAIAPEATILENSATDVAATDPRGVFRLACIVSSATFADATKLAQIRALLEQMKPVHAQAVVGTRTGFRFDDPLSLFDRDLFGV